MGQIILACDDNGKFLEYIPKEIGHRGEGRRHLAITVLLYNSKNQVLLQKRKHQIFDGIWDIGATHPLHLEGRDESLEEAAKRCVKDEFGIDNIDFENLGAFNYFAKDKDNCENEHCLLLVGQYDGEVSLNQEAGYEYKWMEKGEFLKDMEQNPQNYSAWVNKALKIFERR